MINLRAILRARKVLKNRVVHTPLRFSDILSAQKKARIYFKLESYQPIKAFKIRGALYKLDCLLSAAKKKGVVTATTGSHGIALAYAGKIHGVKVIVCMPEKAVKEKLNAIKKYGGKVITYGKDYDEAYGKAQEIREKQGALFIPSVGDPDVIAAQGTVGLEILEDLPEVETIICPVGGGGLISGVSVAAKAVDPKIKVIGVQATGASAVYESWRAGKIIEKAAINTIADGIATRRPKQLTFNIIQKYVDDFFLVDDEEIFKAIKFLLQKEQLIAEPAGAATTAALLFKYSSKPREKVVLIISGANISTELLIKILTDPKY